ncbi:hypothetical protein [Sphingomonas aerophila]|jgi:hypothetical protein|uniref:Uncharacterized protein n=1 Tax=Sphingomonas aerophila TaxID=1344948 RepID=A0A7W9BDL6_9SPHN|nr:hypothetical protein [Sphingomonas aerophila]MBB5715300.1 hypothetical protein [Sphingomonas aerophila]
MRNILLALSAAALVAAPALAKRDTPDVKLAKLLDGRVAGRPTSCILPQQTQNSEIIPGQAIVYRQGGTLWVNRPRSGAESLREDDILVTRQFTSQLCSLDLVRLIDRGSRFERGSVSLGEFTPYRLPPKK